MAKEIWKDIIGYENLYKISNLGKVVNKINGKEKSTFMRSGVKNGGLYVGLNKDSKTKSFPIKRLLFENFNIPYDDETQIDNEIWVDIKGHEGFYQVSDKGRIRSLDRYIWQADKDGNLYQRFMKGKLLSLKRNNGNDYINVQLLEGNGSIEQNYYLHILVAEHFIPNTDNKPTVNHKDGNKSHNYVENLEWATQSEQVRHAYDNGLNFGVKLNKEKAKEIYNFANNAIYTIDELAIKYDVSKRTIRSIQNKKTWRSIHIL